MLLSKYLWVCMLIMQTTALTELQEAMSVILSRDFYYWAWKVLGSKITPYVHVMVSDNMITVGIISFAITVLCLFPPCCAARVYSFCEHDYEFTILAYCCLDVTQSTKAKISHHHVLTHSTTLSHPLSCD
jgi:hypothetical protein